METVANNANIAARADPELDTVLEMVEQHGEGEGSGMEIADLISILYDCWTIMSEEQRQDALKRCECIQNLREDYQ